MNAPNFSLEPTSAALSVFYDSKRFAASWHRSDGSYFMNTQAAVEFVRLRRRRALLLRGTLLLLFLLSLLFGSIGK
jgi:hypothetical protein